MYLTRYFHIDRLKIQRENGNVYSKKQWTGQKEELSFSSFSEFLQRTSRHEVRVLQADFKFAFLFKCKQCSYSILKLERILGYF